MMTEAEMLRLEEAIPELARAASRAAYEAALEVGSVLVGEGGYLVEVRADGTRVRLKPLPPVWDVPAGTTIRLQS